MKTDRLLGILGFVLALVGGVLLLRGALDLGVTLEALARDLLALALGLLAVVGGFFLFTRRHQQGGLVCVVVGLVAILVDAGVTPGVVVLLGGVLGLVAEAA